MAPAAKSMQMTSAMRRLWQDCYKPHTRLILLSLMFTAFFAGVNGLYAPIIKFIVDGLQDGNTDLSWLFIAAFVVVCLKAFAQLMSRRLNIRIFSSVAVSLQKRMYGKMIAADMVWHGREPAAALTARITSDVASLRGMLQRLSNSLVRDVMMIIAVIGSMFYIDWQLTLISIAVFPIAILPLAKIGRTIRKVSRSTQAHIATVSAGLQESLAGIGFAKTYQLEDKLRDRASDDLNQLRTLEIKAGDHSALIDPMMEILGGLAVVGVLFFVSWRIGSGVNTLGDFAGFVTALLLVGQPMRGLANLSAHVQKGMAATERVYAIIDIEPRIINARSAAPLVVTDGSVAFENVSFSYPSRGTIAEAPALTDVTLRIDGGQRVALVGRSGAGKSTLFQLIPRLFDPTAGRVLIDGQDLTTVSVDSLRRCISVVAQDSILFNDTVANNIALGRYDAGQPATRDEIVSAAKNAFAHEFVAALPQGYDTVVGDRGGTLSGGQRQRLSIARAFLRDAPILLLDEPTSALDPEAENAVRIALSKLSRSRTSIVIAHRMSTILDADLIVVLDNGRIVECGTHSELNKHSGIYASFLEKQLTAKDVAV